MTVIDIGIVVPLVEEFMEFRDLACLQAKGDLSGETVTYRFSLEGQPFKPNYECVAIVCGGKAGQKLARATTQYLIDHFRPHHMVLLGIAGRLNRGWKLGDVVVANAVTEYFSQVRRGAQEDRTGAEEHYDVTVSLAHNAHLLLRENRDLWQQICDVAQQERGAIIAQHPESGLLQQLLNGPFQCRDEPIATESAISAAASFVDTLLARVRNLAAIETEAAGFLTATSDVKIPSLVLRGLSDPSDESKAELEELTQDSVRHLAARNATRVFLGLVRSGLFAMPGSNKFRKDRPSSAPLREDALKAYSKNLIAEIQNNLVLELYGRREYEEICITPLVVSTDTPNEDVLDVSRLIEINRSVIVGEPGSGKTTALRIIALSMLRQDPLRTIPIYLPLAAYGTSLRRGEHRSFADFVNEELAVMGCDSLDALESYPGTELLFLLDGWDEIHDEACQVDIKRYVNGRDIRFVLTSRPETQRSLPSARRFEMYPLTKERIREFIRLRFGDEKRVESLCQWINSDPSVSVLAANPLNLSILGIVFAEQGQIERVTRTMLYDRAFEAILNQHHRVHGTWRDEDGHDLMPHIEGILQRLAYKMLKSGFGRFFPVAELQQCAREELEKAPTNITELLCGELGIVRDRRSGRLEFFHLWYQEFLAAKHILSSTKDVLAEFAERRLTPALPYAVGLQAGTPGAYELMRSVPIHDAFSFCRAIREGSFSDAECRQLLERAIQFGGQSQPPLPVRVELARALSQAGSGASTSLFAICRLERNSEYARRAALEALPQLISAERFDRLLIDLMASSSKGLLWHVIEHVGRRKLAVACSALRKYAADDDPITAGGSIWALREIGQEAAVGESLVHNLIGALTAEDHHVQGHALRTLGRLHVADSIPPLQCHIDNPDAPYRWIVPEAAALIGGAGALEILRRALQDGDFHVRAAALKALGDIDEPIPSDLIEGIESSLDDSTWVAFLDQSIGQTARNALLRLRQKGRGDVPATIYIARHCRTKWNSDGLLQGTKDLPLSSEGIEEAKANIEALRPLGINRIISSTALRAQQTAQIYAQALDVPLETSPRLLELDHGKWEGRKIGELLEQTDYRSWLADPALVEIPEGTESVTSAQQRIVELVKNVAMTYVGQTVLLVAHKHILAFLGCALNASPFSNFQATIVESTLPRLIDKEVIRHLGKPS